MRDVRIENVTIGPSHPPVIVAEMSGNHNQSLKRALELVDAAAEAGAHGLKLQTYTADTITIDADGDDFRITDDDNLWRGTNLHQLYQQAHTPWEWHEEIFARCRAHGMFAFSTPFDESAVDFLEELQVPCYKIASFENVDIPLIRRVAQTGKPLIISTGMASRRELSEAVEAAREEGCRDLILLKCTSAYPARAVDCNLATLDDLRSAYDTQVGLSDHTLGLGVPLAAAAMGASLIEKHFTLGRADGGVDAAFSLEPLELRELVIESRRAWEAIGRVQYGPSSDKERRSIKFRRSLYITEDMKAGQRLTPDNLRSIRPGLGLAPKYYHQLLGRIVRYDVRRGTAVSWGLLEENVYEALREDR